ncbi:MAG TPA: hypothetical protein VM198_14880, partial [Longimicrobiales bacterium]|nr:hypothetical protein [Longimicrobiales bacterium]
MGDWLERLRRRKLIQWALAYLAAGWVFLEVAAFLASSFAWPPQVVRALVVVVGVGFFGALVLGWYHGEQGRQRLRAAEVVVLSALAVLAFALVRATWTATIAGPATDATPPRTVGALEVPAEMGSLGVLPFAYPEGDSVSQYFGDGLTEELIYALAGV